MASFIERLRMLRRQAVLKTKLILRLKQKLANKLSQQWIMSAATVTDVNLKVFHCPTANLSNGRSAHRPRIQQRC